MGECIPIPPRSHGLSCSRCCSRVLLVSTQFRPHCPCRGICPAATTYAGPPTPGPYAPVFSQRFCARALSLFLVPLVKRQLAAGPQPTHCSERLHEPVPPSLADGLLDPSGIMSPGLEAQRVRGEHQSSPSNQMFERFPDLDHCSPYCWTHCLVQDRI